MLRVCVSNQRQQKRLEHGAGPLEFGRMEHPQGLPRVVLADPHVSREQLRVTETPEGRLEVQNLSTRTPVYFSDGQVLEANTTRQFNLPVRLTAGTTLIEISLATEPQSAIGTWHTVMEPLVKQPVRQSLNLANLGDSVSPERLAHWFETVISVQRAAAGSAEFYAETARAVVDLVGLDRGMVILHRPPPPSQSMVSDEWEVVASYSTDVGGRGTFSRTMLRRMCEERRTFYRAAEIVDPSRSLMDVEAVVASPIFDQQGQVVGAVYGQRMRGADFRGPEIKPIEAQVVQLLAAAVGSGLARLQREAEAARSRVQFEQFVSPALAQALERDPALLEGRDREVTILFSDIRRFSGVSERLGPAETCRLVGDVMERLSTRTVELAGTVVNYVGDGLIAMWNAPDDQPNHASLACRAALAMLSELPELNKAWIDKMGMPLGLGIGLNTGVARVGNTGSRRRFNYGPLGHTVNLASRVESATKYLGVPLLVTGSTHDRLADDFVSRRLCKARLQGIAGAVDLYELRSKDVGKSWLARRDVYEQALADYESGAWDSSKKMIETWLAEHPDDEDVACRLLAWRSTNCLRSPPANFDPVVEFEQK
jgi:adenylate cyclase